MRRFGLVAVLVLALGAAACSDSDGGAGAASSGKGKEYAEALATSLTEDGSPISESDARCTADGMVDAIGVDQLEEVGPPEDFAAGDGAVDDLELSEAEATGVYQAIDDCMGAKDFVLSSFAADMSDEAVACVDENLSDELVKDFFVSMFQGQEELQANSELMSEMMDAFTPCMEL